MRIPLLVIVGVSFVLGWISSQFLPDEIGSVKHAQGVVIDASMLEDYSDATQITMLEKLEQRLVDSISTRNELAREKQIIRQETHSALQSNQVKREERRSAAEQWDDPVENLGYSQVSMQTRISEEDAAKQQALFEDLITKLSDLSISQSITFENIGGIAEMSDISQENKEKVMGHIAEMMSSGELEPQAFFASDSN